VNRAGILEQIDILRCILYQLRVTKFIFVLLTDRVTASIRGQQTCTWRTL
jgi:hypothetical protein